MHPTDPERARLNALETYRILDSAPEAEFDDLTQLASFICGTPIALISLIDANRQWFKSRRGVTETETGREVAFCAHVVAAGAYLEVEDAREDPRFRDNPLVTGAPQIRFYAGTPLITPEGFGLGTLCVVDRVPRTLSPAQREALAALGRQVGQLLELRRDRLRQQAANADLAQKAAYKQAILDHTAAAIISTDKHGVIATFNRGAEALLGYAAAEAVGKLTPIVFHEAAEIREHAAALSHELGYEVAPGFEVFVLKARQAAEESREWTYVRRDGSRVPVLLSVSAIRSGDGAVRGYLGIARDITARRRAEAALNASELRLREMNNTLERLVAQRTAELKESEARFQQLADQSTDIFWFFGLDPARLLYVSPAVERVWGRPASSFYADPLSWLEAIHPEDRERVLQQHLDVTSGRSPRLETEYRVVRPDRSIRWISDTRTPLRDATGKIVRLGGVGKDVTEKKQAQAQWLRTQRLESIGTLAGGIAHDLNNALAPILMGMDLLRGSSADTVLFDAMDASARHAAGMVKQLLTFAKGAEGARMLLQPRHLIVEMAGLINGTFPKHIKLLVECASTLPLVLGDATQLHQVLLNLCVNARDAMPGGGSLTVRAEMREVDALVADTFSARAGRYVMLEVSDTGSGIPPEILDRVFEPFFTTKAPDKGTGLGLSTVLGIVQGHGGFVRVRSTVGAGTSFSVFLPVAGAGLVPAAVDDGSEPRFCGRGETVLILDDVAAVRTTCEAVLGGTNLNVLTAGDATEALAAVADHRDDLRLIITDLHMPQIDGLVFTRVVRRMLPNVPIIVTSGRITEAEQREFQDLGVAAVIEKPFRREALLDAVASALELDALTCATA